MNVRLRRHLPILDWPRPDARLLRSEALAGLAVGLMVIPQGVAYAALAGMPLVTGIYAAILPALVALMFAASPRLSVGPTALTCLLVSASLTGLAVPGSAAWVALAGWLALLSGVMQVLMGLTRMGWLLNLVNSPVLMAFTQAASLLIIASQLPALLGVDRLEPAALRAAHLPSAAFGLGSLAVLIAVRRWRPAFPSVLVVVLGSAGLSSWLGYAEGGGRIVGALPGELPRLAWPDWPTLATLAQLLLPALVITLVSCLETASSAKVDNERQGRRWNQDQDLVAQGLAKIAGGVSGSFPTSSSFSRSALNLYAGARSGWATLFATAVVLAALLVAMPVLRQVPQAVLAAIVLVAVLGLLKPREFARLWRISRPEAATAAVTFAITLLAAPLLYWGVIAGILMALSQFLYQRLHPRIIEVGLHADGSLRDRHLWSLPPLAPGVYAMRMDAALDFAAADAFERAIVDHLAAHPDVRHVCVFAQPINHIDATGTERFVRIAERLHEQGITLHLSGLKLPVETTLRHAGALRAEDPVRCYRSEGETLAALTRLRKLPDDIGAAAI